MHFVLFYEYGPDIVARRAPHRPAHLEMARDWHARGLLLMAGAWADPIDGAALLFKAPDRALVEEFAASDPYVGNGLVNAWKIREWTVVVGGQTDAGPSES
jgi:hypothetical protein